MFRFFLFFATPLAIFCAPLQDFTNEDEQGSFRSGRQWRNGYDYTVYRPFPSSFFESLQPPRYVPPSYFGHGVFGSGLDGRMGSMGYAQNFGYPAASPFRSPYAVVGKPSGSYSNVNTGSLSSANSISSYGTVGTRLSTAFGNFPGLLLANGQVFNPGFGNSLSGTGFSGSQFAGQGGFVGIQSQASGGGFSSVIHSGSVGYSGFPGQAPVISNVQSTSFTDDYPVNSAQSKANSNSAGAVGATSTSVQAESRTQSVGKGYATSSTHAEAQGYSDGKVGTVNANVETQSSTKGTGAAESIGEANALAHGTTIGGLLKTNSEAATNPQNSTGADADDSPEVVKISSIESHGGGEQIQPQSVTHVYNSGPISETKEDEALPKPPTNSPSSVFIPLPPVVQPLSENQENVVSSAVPSDGSLSPSGTSSVSTENISPTPVLETADVPHANILESQENPAGASAQHENSPETHAEPQENPSGVSVQKENQSPAAHAESSETDPTLILVDAPAINAYSAEENPDSKVNIPLTSSVVPTPVLTPEPPVVSATEKAITIITEDAVNSSVVPPLTVVAPSAETPEVVPPVSTITQSVKQESHDDNDLSDDYL